MLWKKLLLLLTVPLLNPSDIANQSVEQNCLAANIYHEARSELFEGQLAVALVTMNRQGETKSICDVVYAPKQFSWTNHYKVGKFDFDSWEFSKAVASIAIEHPDALGDFYATHYHTHKLRVSWSKKLKKVARIGNHQFYK